MQRSSDTAPAAARRPSTAAMTASRRVAARHAMSAGLTLRVPCGASRASSAEHERTNPSRTSRIGRPRSSPTRRGPSTPRHARAGCRSTGRRQGSCSRSLLELPTDQPSDPRRPLPRLHPLHQTHVEPRRQRHRHHLRLRPRVTRRRRMQALAAGTRHPRPRRDRTRPRGGTTALRVR